MIRGIIVATLLLMANGRRIGTEDPIREILNIFFTLGGVFVFCCAVWVYLDEQKYLSRLQWYLGGRKKKQNLNEEVSIANYSS